MYPVLIAAALLAADAPPEREQALRTAVTTFANAFQEGKLRKAYPLVDEESQEAFLDMAKLKFSKYEWTKLEWADDFTRAKVTLTVDTKWKMPQATVPVRRSWDLAWVWKGGEWLWVHEVPTEVNTPFGVVKARPGEPKADIDLEAAIKNGPKPEDLTALAESTQEVAFFRSKPSEAEIRVTNPMSGYVTFTADLPRIAGLKIDRVKKQAGPKETVAFRLFWTPQPDAAVPDVIHGQVVSEPIGGAHPVTLLFKD
jgi:hypothetical protein